MKYIEALNFILNIEDLKNYSAYKIQKKIRMQSKTI